ncbi:DUF3576 domain-containing protein [Candidatus Pelagibacter sp. Uisw_127]|uniref:DUF3576 domain-containing protein n=1 Tax=Candidatus Pelagibacter sp. Uisw_127 TaxID=3230988 RepID=UPI0039E91732
MINLKNSKILAVLLLITFGFNSCIKLPGGDARKNPPDPKLRVQKNLEEGRGIQFGTGKKGGTGNFEFSSSNELWRASLDTIDFMPLASVNYGGGIIVTDWYSTDINSDESIKISIRFLTNEIRSDSLDIKVFNKKCVAQSNCVVSEKTGGLIPELTAKILKTATIYKEKKKK